MRRDARRDICALATRVQTRIFAGVLSGASPSLPTYPSALVSNRLLSITTSPAVYQLMTDEFIADNGFSVVESRAFRALDEADRLMIMRYCRSTERALTVSGADPDIGGAIGTLARHLLDYVTVRSMEPSELRDGQRLTDVVTRIESLGVLPSDISRTLSAEAGRIEPLSDLMHGDNRPLA